MPEIQFKDQHINLGQMSAIFLLRDQIVNILSSVEEKRGKN